MSGLEQKSTSALRHHQSGVVLVPRPLYRTCRPPEEEDRLPEIHLNGEIRSVGALTVLALVQELGLDVRKVAVEHNLEIVPRTLHAETELVDGDRLELVVFVGGG